MRWGTAAMRDFTFQIRDDRYTVPTLEFVTLATERRARELAEKHLCISAHHLAVEVFEGNTLLFRVAPALDKLAQHEGDRPGA